MASNLYIDEEIHVPTLLEDPTSALFPILRELMGWAQVCLHVPLLLNSHS